MAIRREVGNRSEEATTLNNLGLLYEAQERYEEALDSHEKALIIARELGDRLTEGTILNNLAGIYKAQRRYAEALENYQQALDIRREVGDRAGEAATLHNLGAVYNNPGDRANALESYQQALAIWREMGNQAGEGRTLLNIGHLYKTQGRYAKALDSFQQTLIMIREANDRAAEAVTLFQIGTIYQGQGHYALALDNYQQTLTIWRELGKRISEATTLLHIGVVYDTQGRYGEAIESYQQALVIRREIGNQADKASLLNNLAAIYEELGRYTEAIESHEQALAIWREIDHEPGQGLVLNNLGELYPKQGEYDKALDSLQQALAIWRDWDDVNGSLAAEAEVAILNNFGSVYYRQGRYDEALENYQQVLAIVRELGRQAWEGIALDNIAHVYQAQGQYTEALDYSQQALLILREVGLPTDKGIALHNIGFIYEQQNEPAQALAYYEEAMTLFESLRAVAGNELGRASFIAKHAGLYDSSIRLYHKQGQDEEAFFTSERGRARSFLDSLATGYVQLSDDEAQALFEQKEQASIERQVIQDALAKARALNPPDPELVADLEKRLTEVKQAYAEALAGISARGDQLMMLVPDRENRHVLGVSAVQDLLDEQTTFVSYYLYDNDEALAFVITRDEFRTVLLPVGQAALREQIELFTDFATLEELPAERLQRLYEWLIAPLELDPNNPSLIVVPHNALHYLPFATLYDGQKYLIDQFTLSTLPSASMLPFIAEKGPLDTNNILALGNPVTTLSELRFAQEEVSQIAGSDALVRESATEEALWAQASGASIIHLAAHGKFEKAAPMQSAIYLSESSAHDGRLAVEEIYRLALDLTELVVLSACQTQVGSVNAGDEIVALNRAFFFAGTPTVIATLWSVDDQATARLMERFYTHLREGKGKAEALRQAQIDVRKENPHPYHWAAFVLSGNAGQISPTTPTTSTWTWLLIGGTLLLLLAGIIAFGWHRQANKQPVESIEVSAQ